MNQKIIIDSRSMRRDELLSLLGEVEYAELNTEVKTSGTRAGDVNVITAVVSSVLGFIISLMTIVKKTDSREITIIGKSGWQIKVPANTPAEDVKKYIDSAKEADIDTITV